MTAEATQAMPSDSPSGLSPWGQGPGLPQTWHTQEPQAAEVGAARGLQVTLTQAGPAVSVEPEAGLALTEVGAGHVDTPVLAAAVAHPALVHIWAGRGRVTSHVPTRPRPEQPPEPQPVLAEPVQSRAHPPTAGMCGQEELPPLACWEVAQPLEGGRLGEAEQTAHPVLCSPDPLHHGPRAQS